MRRHAQSRDAACMRFPNAWRVAYPPGPPPGTTWNFNRDRIPAVLTALEALTASCFLEGSERRRDVREGKA